MITVNGARGFRVRLTTGFAIVIAAALCVAASTPTPHPEGLHSKWLTRKAPDLIDAYGEPDHILQTAVRGFVIYGDTPSVMYVYVSNPERGGGCIAAYVIELETELILRYQCR